MVRWPWALDEDRARDRMKRSRRAELVMKELSMQVEQLKQAVQELKETGKNLEHAAERLGGGS